MIESEDYTLFDGDDPRDDDLSGSFAPRLYLNFRTGDCNFTRGRIGGFDIGKDSIGGNSGGGRAMTLTKRNIQFTDGGSRKLSAGVTDEALNLKYLLRLDDTSAQGGTPYVNPNIGAFFNVSGNTDGNFAFAGVGSGALNGYVAGYKVNYVALSNAGQTRRVDFMEGNYVKVVCMASGCKLELPSWDGMVKALGLVTDRPAFAVRLTIVNDDSSTNLVSVVGGDENAGMRDGELPRIVSGGNGIDSFNLTRGETVVLTLISHGLDWKAYKGG